MSDQDHLELWNQIEKTDPAHVKKITGKSYQGSSPSPHWLVRKATETFGPCGIGWGFSVDNERIEDAGEAGKISLARVKVWYLWAGVRGEVEHVGGTPFSGRRKNGDWYMDEDAPKKSVTDALTKALSMIGFAGDIFLGRWDDSGYQSELREEFAEKPKLVSKITLAGLLKEIDRTGTDPFKLFKFYKAPSAAEMTQEAAEEALEMLGKRPVGKF